MFPLEVVRRSYKGCNTASRSGFEEISSWSTPTEAGNWQSEKREKGNVLHCKQFDRNSPGDHSQSSRLTRVSDQLITSTTSGWMRAAISCFIPRPPTHRINSCLLCQTVFSLLQGSTIRHKQNQAYGSTMG